MLAISNAVLRSTWLANQLQQSSENHQFEAGTGWRREAVPWRGFHRGLWFAVNVIDARRPRFCLHRKTSNRRYESPKKVSTTSTFFSSCSNFRFSNCCLWLVFSSVCHSCGAYGACLLAPTEPSNSIMYGGKAIELSSRERGLVDSSFDGDSDRDRGRP